MAWIQESSTVWRSTVGPFLLRNEGGRPILFLRDSAKAGSWQDLTDLFSNPVAPVSGMPAGYLSASYARAGADITLLSGARFTLQGAPFAVLANQTTTATGAAGWYFLTHDGVALQSEKVQASEIIADTERYSPTPAFSASDCQYFSALSSSERILAAYYWSGAAISHFYPYGCGLIKNDSRILVTGSQAVSSSGRARFGATPTYQHGAAALTWQDDATDGTRLTVQRPGLLAVMVCGVNGTGGSQNSGITVNAAAPPATSDDNAIVTEFTNGILSSFSVVRPVQPGDVIGFYFPGGGALTNDGRAKFAARLQELPQ